MVILDTNIIIDHIRRSKGESLLIKFLESTPEELCISPITIQELYVGKSTKNPEKEQELLQVLSNIQILPYSYDVAKRAGKITRDENFDIESADAAIAATAIVYGCSLFTLNTKDFKGVKDLELFSL